MRVVGSGDHIEIYRRILGPTWRVSVCSIGWTCQALACHQERQYEGVLRYMTWHRTPLELISWQLLVGTIPVVLIAYFVDPTPTIIWNQELIFSLLYCGVLATGLAFTEQIFCY